MKVTLRRTGGFAAIPGLDVYVVLDSRHLEPEAAAELEAAVRQAELNRFTAGPSRDSRDGRRYELGVQDDAGTFTVRMADPLPGAAVRDLVDLVLSLGTPTEA